MEIRKQAFYKKVSRLTSVLIWIAVVLVILIFLLEVAGDILASTNFIQGFLEYVFADLLVGIILAALIVRFLERNRSRILNVIYLVDPKKTDQESPDPLTISLQTVVRNVGDTPYLRGDVNCEFLIDSRIKEISLKESAGQTVTGKAKPFGRGLESTEYSVINGFISSPLIPGLSVGAVTLEGQMSAKDYASDLNIFYSMVTPYEKFPTHSTEDILLVTGYDGTPVEMLERYRVFGKVRPGGYYDFEKIVVGLDVPIAHVENAD
jgi:hypothetical protein